MAMTTRVNQVMAMKSPVPGGTRAGDENGVPALKNKQGGPKGSSIAAQNKAVPPRRPGLSLLSNNVRRPKVVAIAKKTAPIPYDEDEDEPKKPTKDAPGPLLATHVKAPGLLFKRRERTEDVLAPDSYAPIDVLKFMTDSEILAVRSMKDPDADGVFHESLNAEYVKDVFVYLRDKREVEMKLETNFMKGSRHVLPSHRRVVVDWIATVQDKFGWTPETLYIAVYVLDDFASKKKDLPTNRYQLAGLAALVIASKFEEVERRSIDDLVFFADNQAITRQGVLKMEREVLRTVGFSVSRPVPITFLRRYSKLADVVTDVHAMAKFLMELSLHEYNISGIRPSKLAAAALFLSMKLSDMGKRPDALISIDETHSFWDAKLTFFTHYPAQVVLPAVYEICAVVVKAFTASNEDIHVIGKYSSAKYYRVSKSPLLRSSRLVRMWGAKSVLMPAVGDAGQPAHRSHPTTGLRRLVPRVQSSSQKSIPKP